MLMLLSSRMMSSTGRKIISIMISRNRLPSGDGGKDIKIFGSGLLNGNGQRWYNEFAGMEILVCLVSVFGLHLLIEQGPG